MQKVLPSKVDHFKRPGKESLPILCIARIKIIVFKKNNKYFTK